MADRHTPHVAFEYDLLHLGWSRASLTIGTATVSLTASYLSDALGDLVAAASVLHRATSTVRVAWAEEPGDFRWVLDRAGDDLSVQVLGFDETWAGDPDDRGTVLLSARCTVAEFRNAVARGARAVLERWGEAGYRQAWHAHDFPTAALAALEGT